MWMSLFPDLDLRKIRRVVRNFSEAVDMPGMLSNLERVLARKRQRVKRTSRKR